MGYIKKLSSGGIIHLESILLVVIVIAIASFGVYDAHKHLSHADFIGTAGGSVTSDTTPLGSSNSNIPWSFTSTTGSVTNAHAAAVNTENSSQVLFRNPLRDIRGLVPWRIDEGVDYRGVGPVYAVGPAVITDVEAGTSHFFAAEDGNIVIYKLTAGPAHGRYIYVGEACSPTYTVGKKVVPYVKVGEIVSDTTVICHMFGGQNYPGIETGEWHGPVDNGVVKGPKAGIPLAMYYGQYGHDGNETAFGVNMNDRMIDLGAPKGNSAGHVSYNNGHIVGHLPNNWPAKFEPAT